MVKRGEIWLAQLDPTIGTELKKTRPCVVVSPPELNDRLHTVIVAPMTTAGSAAPFRISISFQEKRGLVLLDQVRAVDKTRLVKRLGCAPSRTIAAVLLILQEMFAT